MPIYVARAPAAPFTRSTLVANCQSGSDPSMSLKASAPEVTHAAIDDCRKCEARIPNLANSFEFLTWHHGLGCGVGRGLGMGVTLGVAVGVTLGVGLGVTLGVGLGVAVGVADGVGVGVGLAWQVSNQLPALT